MLKKESKYPTISNSKPLSQHKLISWFAAGVALFHIWANTIGNISELWRNCLHFGLLGCLAFLLYPGIKRRELPLKISKIGSFLALLALSTSLYLLFFEEALHVRNEVPIWSDLLFAGLALILALELARRTSGYVIPILAIFFLTYVLWWGSLVQGIFHFRGMTIVRVLYRMFFTDEGLFGMITSISSTYVFMFILFAAFLLKSGGGDFIIKLAQSLTRRITGGLGLVSVLASGLMGTISGSAVANTVTTGAITIPMMKKSGYDPKFAAAVESAASTGGQLMPPIMGAGAFIMSQWTQIPYSTIILVALLPAFLYFASVAFYVYLEAKKNPLAGMEHPEPEPLGRILRDGIHFIVPILFLIGMLIAGFTPTYTAGLSLVVVVISSWFSREHKMSFQTIVEALALGTRNMITTGLLLVAAGIIVGIINMTGISITFSQLVIEWSGMNLGMALILIAGASLLLGMGLPVTAAYIMIAILTVPALTAMGVPLLTAHMIIFWLSQDSNVTPPVCLASFAAASIAGSRPLPTGLTSWKLAKGLYIMPLLFAFTGLISGGWGERFIVFGFAFMGLFASAAAFTGYLLRPLAKPERFVLGLSAVAMFWPHNLVVNGLGLSVLFVIGILNVRKPQ